MLAAPLWSVTFHEPFLKRPDIINGAISMSGVYDLSEYTKGYWDEQVYYNSPIHYVPNLTDSYYLDKIKASHHIHIYTGSGDYEDPEANRRFSQVLWDKGIWHDLDIWGQTLSTIGLPGGRCCLILSTQNFKMTSHLAGIFWARQQYWNLSLLASHTSTAVTLGSKAGKL